MVSMLITMNDQIRQVVRIELTKRDIKQADLAKKLEVSRQYLNDLMRGKTGFINPTWEKVFEELGFELIPIPKDKVSTVKKTLVD